MLAKKGVAVFILPRMSPKLRVALVTLPLTRKSLREIGALLPEDDAQLLVWIEEEVGKLRTAKRENADRLPLKTPDL